LAILPTEKKETHKRESLTKKENLFTN